MQHFTFFTKTLHCKVFPNSVTYSVTLSVNFGYTNQLTAFMRYKMYILFWIRKNKLNSKKEAPIYCRITIDGVRTPDFSTNILTKIDSWDSKRQRVRDEIKQQQLDAIRQKLCAIHLDLELKDIPVTAYLVKNLYTKKDSIQSKYTVKQLFSEYIELHKKKRAAGTIKNYNVRYNLLSTFLQVEQKCNITAEYFNINFAKQYFNWLCIKESHNYSVRAVEICRIILQHAFENDKIKCNPLAGLKLKQTAQKKIVWLTPEEVILMETHKFGSSALQKASDMFLFQCYTGLDYGDLMSVSTKDIQLFQGDNYIVKNRIKSGEESIIPYTSKIDMLWKKYNYSMPQMENQPYNRFLKEIANILELNKRITSHVGRKTFTMNKLNHEGYSMEATSKMAGHSSVKTTETHYAKVNLSLIKMETMRLNLTI